MLPRFNAEDIAREQRDLRNKARRELEFVDRWLGKYLGCEGRWNGNVFIGNPNINSSKSLHCYITINVNLHDVPDRWATYLHEMIHAYSKGFTIERLKKFPGWEEGTVEKFQRELRHLMLADLPRDLLADDERDGNSVDEKINLNKYGVIHPYNTYINSIDAIRLMLGQENVIGFYRDLILMPLNERSRRLRQQIENKQGFSLYEAKMFELLNQNLNDYTLVALLERSVSHE